eukprot:Sro753_g197340.1 Histone-lysine N-methyltransferase (143) ;mRNA; r:16888-17316
MVALRDIAAGEEICITYVPNGDLDAGGSSERFQHHTPTRTWKWLNHKDCNSDDDNLQEQAENSTCASHEEEVEVLEGSEASSATCEGNDDQVAMAVEEGADPKARSIALFAYGFDCSCARCTWEKVHPNRPYERDMRPKKRP